MKKRARASPFTCWATTSSNDRHAQNEQKQATLPNGTDRKPDGYRPTQAQECRYCDITELDCPERLEGTEETTEAATEDF